MVRVITIMDDVYVELNRLKKSKGMSFSEVIRYLLHERNENEKQLKVFAGTIKEDDVDKRALMRISNRVF
ncbi:MAG: antitoxin VapB family protein [Candidatus Bilamarchaeaceae archaeon]